MRRMERDDWWEDYIEVDPDVMVGKPVVKGTRLTVEHVLMVLGAGWSLEEVLDSYPNLTEQGLRAVFAFASDCMRDLRLSEIVPAAS